MRKFIFIVLITSLLSSIVIAQSAIDTNSNLIPLKGRHSIALNFGLLSQQTATVYTVGIEAESNIMGAIFYNYWFNNEWALEFNTGILNAEVFGGITFAGIEQKAATIIPILIGARFYPEALALEENVRPYLIGLVGAHLGHSSSDKITLGLKIGSETKIQSAFAVKVGAGVDAFLGGWVRIGLYGGYNIGTDFKEPVGTRANYSGIDFGLSFGIMF